MVANSSDDERTGDRIIAYLRHELDAGYDITTLRNSLLSQGYPQDLVDVSIDKLYQKERKSIILPFSLPFLRNKVVLFSILALALLGIAVIIFLFIGEEKSETKIPLTGSETEARLDRADRTNSGDRKNQTNLVNDATSSIFSDDKERKDQDLVDGKITVKNVAVDTTERPDAATITQYTLEAEIVKFNNGDDARDFCKKNDVINDVMKDDCYAVVASRFEQPRLCIEISNAAKKENCILELAWSEGGYEFCGEISDARKQNLCRNIAGVRSRDLSNNLAFEHSPKGTTISAAYRNATEEEITRQNVSIQYRAIEGGSIIITK